MMRYSNLELWQFIQQHPDFSNYCGSDTDLRDRNKKNPGMSIDLVKGQWYNHNEGKGGGLYELAKKLNVLPEIAKKIPTPNEIWKQLKLNDKDVKLYFTQGRCIPENHYSDIFRFLRTDYYNGLHIVHPYFSFESWQAAFSGKVFDVPRIQRIWFDSSGHKTCLLYTSDAADE